MSEPVRGRRVAHLVDPHGLEVLDVMGPTVRFFTRPQEDDSSPCVMQGTVPPGTVIPLHSHSDPETFLAISGVIDGLAETADDFAWLRIAPGDVFHVPGGAKHAFRNRSLAPAVMFILSTSRIGRFFQEIGIPAGREGEPPAPPSDETIRRFLETAERYGYWNATAEENAQVGLSLPGA